MTKNLYVSIIGEPNVGKSTLLNAMIGYKIAITTPKAQTTRKSLNGIVTIGDIQYVITDTPGLLSPKSKLDRSMRREIFGRLFSSNVVLFVVYPKEHLSEHEIKLLMELHDKNLPVFLVVNKSDIIRSSQKKGNYYIEKLSEDFAFSGGMLVSARDNDGVEELLKAISIYAEEGIHEFDPDDMTDESMRSLVAEILREKIFLNLRDEIPYGCAVVTDSYTVRDDGIVDISFTIFCDKQNHKSIIIGKRGSMLKKISSEARSEIEDLVGGRVYMQSWIKVQEDWRNNDSVLHDLDIQ